MGDNQRKDEIRKKLNEVFCEVFDDDQIEIFDEMTAKDIPDWDSLMHITLVVAMEKEFGFRLNAEEISKLVNVGAMIDLLEQYGVN